MRKNQSIKPRVEFARLKGYIYILPSVLFVRWKYRQNNSYVVEIFFLTFHIGIGLWQRKKGGGDNDV